MNIKTSRITLFIEGLSLKATDLTLKQAFAIFGIIKEARIAKDTQGCCIGFATLVLEVPTKSQFDPKIPLSVLDTWVTCTPFKTLFEFGELKNEFCAKRVVLSEVPSDINVEDLEFALHKFGGVDSLYAHSPAKIGESRVEMIVKFETIKTVEDCLRQGGFFVTKKPVICSPFEDHFMEGEDGCPLYLKPLGNCAASGKHTPKQVVEDPYNQKGRKEEIMFVKKKEVTRTSIKVAGATIPVSKATEKSSYGKQGESHDLLSQISLLPVPAKSSQVPVEGNKLIAKENRLSHTIPISSSTPQTLEQQRGAPKNNDFNTLKVNQNSLQITKKELPNSNMNSSQQKVQNKIDQNLIIIESTNATSYNLTETDKLQVSNIEGEEPEEMLVHPRDEVKRNNTIPEFNEEGLAAFSEEEKKMILKSLRRCLKFHRCLPGNKKYNKMSKKRENWIRNQSMKAENYRVNFGKFTVSQIKEAHKKKVELEGTEKNGPGKEIAIRK